VTLFELLVVNNWWVWVWVWATR